MPHRNTKQELKEDIRLRKTKARVDVLTELDKRLSEGKSRK